MNGAPKVPQTTRSIWKTCILSDRPTQMYTSFERSVEQVLLADFSKRLRQAWLFFGLWWQWEHEQLINFKNVIRTTATPFYFSSMKTSRLYMPIIKRTLSWGSCCNSLKWIYISSFGLGGEYFLIPKWF